MSDQLARYWEACSTIDRFLVRYEVRLSDFTNLKQLGPTYADVDEKHWVRAMQDKTKPHWKKRAITIRIAELIENAPNVLFALMPSAQAGRSRLLDLGRRHASPDSERVDLYVQSLIERAGQGQARHFFTLLVLEAAETLPYAHEEAISRLRGAIYIANRYLPPPYFISSLKRLVLPSLQQVTVRLSPFGRGSILSQLACYALDHECGRS